MAENLILPFAYADGANVLSQSDYQADNQRLIGHQPGIARSALENKALRQATAMAAGLAQFIADGQAVDVTDAKTPAEIAAMLGAAANNLTEASFSGLVGYIVFGNGFKIACCYSYWGNSPTMHAGTVTLPVAFTNNPSVIATVASGYGAGDTNFHLITARATSGTKIEYNVAMRNGGNVTSATGVFFAMGV